MRFLWLRSDNGRFLRHRPKRSERGLNYERMYQGHGPLPKSQGVPEGPKRKNHVVRRTTPTLRLDIAVVVRGNHQTVIKFDEDCPRWAAECGINNLSTF